MATTITRLELTPSEAEHTRVLLKELTSDITMFDQYHLLEQAPVYAQELPRRVREAFHRFKRDEADGALLVSGNPVLESGAGPTPTRYVETEPDFRLNDAQVLHALYGSLLGEGVGFTSQRGGSVFNTIVPMPELAGTANSSSGSTFDFGFHVEDAFHPTRAEYIGLVCMRNDERAATTISAVDGVELTDEERAVLFEPRFTIPHNPIHSTSGVVLEERQPVLFGALDRPYVRVNFAAIDITQHGGIERQALEKLLHHFENNRASVVLQATDCIYIDNFRCVHARDAFDALPPGQARWLCRVVFTSDLRKSRGLRADTATRAIAA